MALVISFPLMFLYSYIGFKSLAIADGVYFIINILLWKVTLKQELFDTRITHLFIVLTISLVLYGHVTGDELIDNKPWALIIPIVTVSLTGPREGSIWSLLAMVGLGVIYLFTSNYYEPFSIMIQIASMLATTYVLAVFMHYNDKNIGIITQFSNTDELTQTFNRHYFETTFENEVRKAKRNHSPFSILMIDIDQFKDYNDCYGHLEGDEVLRKVAKSLIDSSRRVGDLVYRYGGEEFCILLTNIEPEFALAISNHICLSVEELNIAHKISPYKKITVSIGLAHSDKHQNNSAKETLKIADQALYQAKDKGKNQVVSMAG